MICACETLKGMNQFFCRHLPGLPQQQTRYMVGYTAIFVLSTPILIFLWWGTPPVSYTTYVFLLYFRYPSNMASQHFNPKLLTKAQHSRLTARLDRNHILQGHCHIWSKSVNSRGYPMIKISVTGQGSHTYLAHRIIYSLHHNTILRNKFIHISHLCHNKLCINPDHLSLEPPSINMARNTCKIEGSCLRHDIYPDCKL